MKLPITTVLCLLFTSLSVNSASLGTYRVYLDGDRTKQKFPVINRSVEPEKCNIEFRSRKFDGQGNLIKMSKQEQEDDIAPVLKRFRYSPKEFTIQGNSTQHVMFSYRRAVNSTPGEMRVYAAFICKKEQDEADVAQGGFTPQLELVVPIVIRTGKSKQLTANLSHEKFDSTTGEPFIRLLHSGNRSLYGDVNLLDSQGKILSQIRKSAVIYPDMKALELPLPSLVKTTSNLYVEFKEKGKFEDNKTIRLAL